MKYAKISSSMISTGYSIKFMPKNGRSDSIPKVRYSICVTHYNNARTLRAALDSMLDIIDDQFEIVVVDKFSSDGSTDILREYASKNKIRLFKKNVSRGLGRTAALEHALGDYIISGLDMDDTFKPRLKQLLAFYHEKCEGLFLRTEVATIIAPKTLLLYLGGWNDLQFNENWELSNRAANMGKFRWTIFPLLETINEHPERKTLLGRITYMYIRIRDRYRVGKRPFGGSKRIRLSHRFVQAGVILTLPFFKSYKKNHLKGFTIVNRQYFVDSSDWWADLKDSVTLRKKYKSLLGSKV